MSARNVHPLYTAMLKVWEQCRDSYGGQKAIKDKRGVYLPPTSGMRLDGYPTENTPGTEEYNAYLMRAYYPDTYEEAVNTAVGIMHRKPAEFQLPPGLKALLSNATPAGETMQMVLRQINAEQLKTGRLGILGDIVKNPDGSAQPVILLYNEKCVRNWDDRSKNLESDDLRFVCLDESSNEMTNSFSWEWKEKYRVLMLQDASGKFLDQGVKGEGIYKVAELDDKTEIMSGQYNTPSLQGQELKTIPFSFINATDISSSPDQPPLMGLSQLCLAIYRAEADYRQNLFMQGQDTLVRIGATDTETAVRTGAGARIDVPITGDAKYIGVSGSGLGEQRQSLDKDYIRASQRAGQLVDSNIGAEESAEALNVRIAARSATLPDIARAGAKGLEKVLRDLAVWYGEDPSLVVVKPNLEFATPKMNSRTLVEIAEAKDKGAPISDESIHAWMLDNKFTVKTFEEEMAAIQNEEPRI